jgi:hypothetical protein
MKNGSHLILEVEWQDTQEDRTKWEFLDEWIRAVNTQSGFGKWQWGVARQPGDVEEILEKAGH